MEKKSNYKEYLIYLTQKRSQSFLVYRIHSKENILQKKKKLRKRESTSLNQKNEKKAF